MIGSDNSGNDLFSESSDDFIPPTSMSESSSGEETNGNRSVIPKNNISVVQTALD